MKYHFSRIGDQIPNSNGEIHLEPQDKKEIWAEYVEMSCDVLNESNHVSYSAFLQLWKSSFSHVKIREYKQVRGPVILLCCFVFCFYA
jgi:hypothetical protein